MKFANNITNTQELDIYPIFSPTRLVKDNLLEPDIDVTLDISSKYLFAH